VTGPTDVQALRRELQARAPFLDRWESLSTGWAELDEVLGGFPRGGITLVSGQLGSGRTTVVARCLAALTARSRAVAWVDGAALLYPPGLHQLGLSLERLLMVRHVGERGVFALEQIVGSGLFSGVASFGQDRWLTSPRWRRLQTASEGARVATVMVVKEELSFSGAALKLRTERRGGGVRVSVEKDRSGRATGRVVDLAEPVSPIGINMG
jgi:hypothetical protein